MRRTLEKRQEARFVKWCHRSEQEAIKLNTVGPYGAKGWPDRLWLGFAGLMAWFEFKRIGEPPPKKISMQYHRHKWLRKRGHNIYVVYTCDEAIAICRYLYARAISKGGDKVRHLKTRCRVLFGAGFGKDDHYSNDLQVVKEARAGRHTVRVGKASNRVRRVATRNPQMEAWTKYLDRSRQRKARGAVRE